MSRYESGDGEGTCNTAEAIIAGMALADPTVLVENHALAFVLPQGAKVERVDIEQYLPRPTRKRGVYNFGDAKSFIAFVNREKTRETFILANRENPGFTAVFNGNQEERNTEGAENLDAQPGWGDYKATYACPFSPEWRAWKEGNGVKMAQAEFALFIEDNFLDIIVPEVTFDPYYQNWPDSNAMLAVSRGLAARTDVKFASAVRLDNGQVQFKYEEEINSSVQGGMFDVPQKFAVGIPVFAGTRPWAIPARLRYRIERGGLTMWYDFERLFKITERAFDEARAEIATGTNVPIYLGSKT